MSLSVEDMRFILSKLESCELATYDEDEQPCRGADKIIAAALRELIAIKEAEPVAWLSDLGGAYFVSHERKTIESITGSAPLIRKPE